MLVNNTDLCPKLLGKKGGGGIMCMGVILFCLIYFVHYKVQYCKTLNTGYGRAHIIEGSTSPFLYPATL
jgi:hypothetical protein